MIRSEMIDTVRYYTKYHDTTGYGNVLKYAACLTNQAGMNSSYLAMLAIAGN